MKPTDLDAVQKLCDARPWNTPDLVPTLFAFVPQMIAEIRELRAELEADRDAARRDLEAAERDRDDLAMGVGCIKCSDLLPCERHPRTRELVEKHDR